MSFRFIHSLLSIKLCIELKFSQNFFCVTLFSNQMHGPGFTMMSDLGVYPADPTQVVLATLTMQT